MKKIWLFPLIIVIIVLFFALLKYMAPTSTHVLADQMTASAGEPLEEGGWLLDTEGSLTQELDFRPGAYIVKVEAKGDYAEEIGMHQEEIFTFPVESSFTFPQILEDLDPEIKVVLLNQVVENGEAFKKRQMGMTVAEFRQMHTELLGQDYVESINITDDQYSFMEVLPTKNGWPMMIVKIDSVVQRQLDIDSSDWSMFEIPVVVPHAGAVLSIEFANDYFFHTRNEYGDYDYLAVIEGQADRAQFAEQDRNLYIRSVSVAAS